MSFLACLPLIEADLPSVLALDQRCLGGLWTRSGYLRELDSPSSDLYVLVSSTYANALRQRQVGLPITAEDPSRDLLKDLSKDPLEPLEKDFIELQASPLTLLGVGCLWAILEEAHITTLAIEPAYQGQKLGQLLLSRLLLCARQRGLTHATLEVRASNHKALKLYQKFNFQEAGVRKRYYADDENARILWRSELQSDEALAQINEHQQRAIAYLQTQHQYGFLA